jgi:hypothetical protein
MKIIDHGMWVRYVPEPWPKDMLVNVMFCKNDDGKDWYEYIKGDEFVVDSIKMTVLEDIVRAVYRDASMLFPQGCRVLEIVYDPIPDPQAKYGGKLYNAEANSFADPSPPQPLESDLIKELLTHISELRKRVEELEAR